MKKMLKKVAVFLVAVMLVAVVVPTNADAASKVIVHVQDGEKWGNVSIYNYSDVDGEIAGAWPGTPMKADSVDGWFTYTLEPTSNLNLVFNNGAKLQSGDVKDIAIDKGECWIVIGGDSEKNDMGASAIAAKLYTEPKEGWPVAAAASDATAKEATTETTTATTTDAEPATGDTTPILVVSIAALASMGVFVAAKKRKMA